MSFIVKFDDNNTFLSSTYLRVLPKISMSSYKQMLIPLLDSSNYYINTYLTDLTKPFDKIISANHEETYVDAFFSPYNEFINLYILYSLQGTIKPLGFFIYIYL